MSLGFWFPSVFLCGVVKSFGYGAANVFALVSVSQRRSCDVSTRVVDYLQETDELEICDYTSRFS